MRFGWTWQHPIAARSLNGATLTIYDKEPIESNYYLDGSLMSDTKPGDGLVVASGTNPDRETYAVTLKPDAGTWNQLGIDVVQDESLPGARYARGADRFLLSEIEAELVDPGVPARTLALTMATVNDAPPSSPSSNVDPSMPPLAAIDGDPRDGVGHPLWRGAQSVSRGAVRGTGEDHRGITHRRDAATRIGTAARGDRPLPAGALGAMPLRGRRSPTPAGARAAEIRMAAEPGRAACPRTC